MGLTLFIALVTAGVDALLVERHTSTARVPKALFLNARTMEVFRQLGLETEVRRAALPAEEVGFLFQGQSLVAGEYTRERMWFDNDYAAAQPCLCSQDALEPVLVKHAERIAPGRVLFGTAFDALTQDDEDVTAELTARDSRERRTVRVKYLIGADGARSSVRQAVDIALDGDPSLGHFVHILFDADLSDHLAGRVSAVSHVAGPDLPRAQFVIVDGQRRWRLMVPYSPQDGQRPEDFTADRCIALVRAGTGVRGLPVTIRGVWPWEPAAVVAERFAAGRVMLAGDAAHVCPPWGGFGMNSGIGDAHNLAWKLAEVDRGAATAALLETYEAERRAVAQLTVTEAVRNGRQELVTSDPEKREAAERRRQGNGLVLGNVYASAAVVPDSSEPPAVADVHTDYVPVARPGHRAPHFWVRNGSSRMSITDLLGAGFVLLTGPEGSRWSDAAAQLSPELRTSVRTYVIGRELEDESDGWTRLYCASPEGAVLIRPDWHVCWRSAALPPDPRSELEQALRRILLGG